MLAAGQSFLDTYELAGGNKFTDNRLYMITTFIFQLLRSLWRNMNSDESFRSQSKNLQAIRTLSSNIPLAILMLSAIYFRSSFGMRFFRLILPFHLCGVSAIRVQLHERSQLQTA